MATKATAPRKRYLVILSNDGGELDRRQCASEGAIKMAVEALIDSVSSFRVGDTVTITEETR